MSYFEEEPDLVGGNESDDESDDNVSSNGDGSEDEEGEEDDEVNVEGEGEEGDRVNGDNEEGDGVHIHGSNGGGSGSGGMLVIPSDAAIYADPNYDAEVDPNSNTAVGYHKTVSKHINSQYLYAHHPELLMVSQQEVTMMSQVTRSESGRIIDKLHTTAPFLTKYERAKILGVRAKQINEGSPPMTVVPDHLIDGYAIAVRELQDKKIPFIIQRTLPSGVSEFWKVADLEQL
jgi:DNA-directed RNA polymerase subunit K/omega